MDKQTMIRELVERYGFTPRKARWDVNAQLQGWATAGYWMKKDTIYRDSR